MSTIDLPLRDIHLPVTIPWWPLAPGWWLLFVVILALLLLLLFFVRKALKPSLKKEAKRELRTIENMLAKSGNPAHCIAELSLFLRRMVLKQEYDEPPAGLTGDRWLQLLDQQIGSTEFSTHGHILLEAPYRAQAAQEDAIQLLQLCHKWVNCL